MNCSSRALPALDEDRGELEDFVLAAVIEAEALATALAVTLLKSIEARERLGGIIGGFLKGGSGLDTVEGEQWDELRESLGERIGDLPPSEATERDVDGKRGLWLFCWEESWRCFT